MNPWMDSDSAYLVAQQAGGSGIRKRFPMCTVTAWLSQEPGPPFETVWEITYECNDSTRVVDIDASTAEVVRWMRYVTSVNVGGSPTLPGSTMLSQNYPNPFNPSTTISYSLPQRTYVMLSVYDVLGRQLEVLVSKVQEVGFYEVIFRSAGLSSGIYFYRLAAGSTIAVKKMLLEK